MTFCAGRSIDDVPGSRGVRIVDSNAEIPPEIASTCLSRPPMCGRYHGVTCATIGWWAAKVELPTSQSNNRSGRRESNRSTLTDKG